MTSTLETPAVSQHTRWGGKRLKTTRLQLWEAIFTQSDCPEFAVFTAFKCLRTHLSIYSVRNTSYSSLGDRRILSLANQPEAAFFVLKRTRGQVAAQVVECGHPHCNAAVHVFTCCMRRERDGTSIRISALFGMDRELNAPFDAAGALALCTISKRSQDSLQ